MSVVWAHGFESTKIRVKKMHPKLDLSMCYLMDFSETVVEYGSYDDSSYV